MGTENGRTKEGRNEGKCGRVRQTRRNKPAKQDAQATQAKPRGVETGEAS